MGVDAFGKRVGEALSLGKLMLPGLLCGCGIVGEGSMCGIWLACLRPGVKFSDDGFWGVAGSFLEGRLGGCDEGAVDEGLGLLERSVKFAEP